MKSLTVWTPTTEDNLRLYECVTSMTLDPSLLEEFAILQSTEQSALYGENVEWPTIEEDLQRAADALDLSIFGLIQWEDGTEEEFAVE